MSQTLSISTRSTKGVADYPILLTALWITRWVLSIGEVHAQTTHSPQLQPLTITVRLIDAEADTVVSNARLVVIDEKSEQGIPVSPEKPGFTVSALPGTSLLMQASAPAYLETRTRIGNLSLSQQLILKLTHFKPSILTIKAFAMDISQPLSPATAVITSRTTGRSQPFSLTNGQLQLTFLKADKLDIQVSSPGYTAISRQLTIGVQPSGGRYEFDAELDKMMVDLTIRAVDNRTEKPVSGGRFSLTGADGTAHIIPSADPKIGLYNVTLPGAGTYQLVSTTEGYEAFTRSLAVGPEEREVLVKLVAKSPVSELKPASINAKPAPRETAVASVSAVRTQSFGVIEKGKRIRLNKIYFDQSSPVLRPESSAELDQLYDVLTKNPSIRMEIRGHTDNQGDLGPNIQLSRDRCQAVVDYLVRKGIGKLRLKAVGRGPLDPVAPNNNEENRRKNRRVEFILL